MKLNELNSILGYDVEEKIRSEFKEFRDNMYAGKSLEERKILDQFFTPPDITIPLLESLLDTYEDNCFKNKTILDPTSGSGNLLAACLIAGADSDKIFGNDYDARMVTLCRERLNKICDLLGIDHIRSYQIHQGNALQTRCLTDFSTTYDRYYNPEFIDDLTYAQGTDKWGRHVSWEEDNKAHTKPKFTRVGLFDDLF